MPTSGSVRTAAPPSRTDATSAGRSSLRTPISAVPAARRSRRTSEPATPDVAEERKVVSVLFADLAGFTAQSDGADPEDMKARLDPYFARAREVIESLGGIVEKFIGDAVVGLFGAPTSREDDAARAVQAAWEIARAIDALNDEDPTLELSIRIAVDTGEAVVDLNADVERGEAFATGDVLNTASRLQHEAPIGGVVVGERTYRASVGSFDWEALEPVSVKGQAAPIPIWLVLGVRPEHDRAPLAPLIGRRSRAGAPRDGVGQGSRGSADAPRHGLRSAGDRQEPARAGTAAASRTGRCRS